MYKLFRATWRSLAVIGAALVLIWVCLGSDELIGGKTGLLLVGGKPELPALVGEYSGTLESVGERERRILPEDTGFARRNYSIENDGRRMHCSLVLAGADRNSIHRPEVCLPGQGWAIEERFKRPARLSDGSDLDVMVLLVSREQESEAGEKSKIFAYYVYWFLGMDTATASHFTRLFLTSWDPIVRGVNHRWAYVNLLSIIDERLESREETLLRIEGFAGELVPLIWDPKGANDVSIR